MKQCSSVNVSPSDFGEVGLGKGSECKGSRFLPKFVSNWLLSRKISRKLRKAFDSAQVDIADENPQKSE